MKVRVGVLGATGAVGQRFVELLSRHPMFELGWVAASERSAGRRYGDVVRWYLDEPMPERARTLEILPCEPGQAAAGLVFSALDAGVAGAVEERFAEAGFAVVSNARNHRLDSDVPLLVPEVNPDHLDLIVPQRSRRARSGYIVTNPNCSTVGLALALHPLERSFGIRRVIVATLQALSGAGYPGVSALDATDNVLPFIEGEEEKIQAETRKILGTAAVGRIEPADFGVSALVHRVPVRDGHMLAISVELRERAGPADVQRVLADFRGPQPVPTLPSSPEQPIIVRHEPDRPQPRKDRMAGGGMSVTVGRVRPCEVLDVKFSALVHNTLRGAAGAALQNAELLHLLGYIPGVEPVAQIEQARDGVERLLHLSVPARGAGGPGRGKP